MTAYYNENDAKMAAWLRELMKDGLIAPGDVDERSIEDVTPNDLRNYTQCHFFAGIGVWSYALRLAGWPDDRPVWTGSCPCQPFSVVGKGGGFDDERHLWPAWHWLISECKEAWGEPVTVFGEQVASKNGLAWLDLVQSDMEAAGYAVGATDFCSASVGAPHIRQRLYFVADASDCGRQPIEENSRFNRTRIQSPEPKPESSSDNGNADDLGDADDTRSQGRQLRSGGDDTDQLSTRTPVPTNGFWQDAEWIYCRDERWRPIPPEPALFPVVNGTTAGRVGILRGAGNAINAQQAKAFIESYLDVCATGPP